MYELVNADFYLDFFIRCDDPDGHIQARFEDSNEDLQDPPWRMNYHIDNNVVPFDGDWQRVTIPLADMEDQGAWDPDDGGVWYNGGEGLQDWSRVQRLQFVSETRTQPETEIYLDRIRIVDAIAINDQEPAAPVSNFRLEANYPNPFNPETTRVYITGQNVCQIVNFQFKGKLVKTIVNNTLGAGAHQVMWHGTDNADKSVSSGIYFYKLETDNARLVRQMLLIK